MEKLKKGDYVKFKTNNHPEKGSYKPGSPMVGFGFVKGTQAPFFVDILTKGEYSDYRAHTEDCEHVEGINAFDVIGRILRNRSTYDSLLSETDQPSFLDQLTKRAEELQRESLCMFAGIRLVVDPNLKDNEWYVLVSKKVFDEVQKQKVNMGDAKISPT